MALYNLARMSTATTGTGTITLGSAIAGFLTFALAGVADGEVVSYGIKDGANSEIGTGTYTSAGTTLTRSVTKSTNSDSAISLSGTAEVFITPRAEDIVQSIDGVAGAFTFGTGLTRSSNVLSVSLSSLTNTLGADVNLNSTGSYFTGPTVAQGTTGTFIVVGQVTLRDTAGSAAFNVRITDGTNVHASTRSGSISSSASISVPISAIVTSPAGDLRIQCNDPTSTSGLIQFNASGNSKDSTISVFRIA
jgi:hypothetical protein